MKPGVIIDCSIAMAWCFADEATPETTKIQDQLIDGCALVPSVWFLEVTNVLLVAERRKRISITDATEFLRLLGALDIHVDNDSSSRVFDYVFPLARNHSLTSYDAAYLELAVRSQLPLASLDNDLRSRALSLGLEVVGK